MTMTSPMNAPPAASFVASRAKRLFVLLALGTALSGCGSMLAQNPGSPLTPVRASAIGNDAHVMLDGHDVVAYFTQGRHAKGSPQFKAVHQGVSFYFVNAEHQALFEKAPTRYLPQYGGFCANGIVYAIPWGGDADAWRIIDGKLYIFGGAGSRAAFELDTRANVALADRYWAEEVSGSNSFWQRSKRLVLRVPHYKSGAELDRLLKEAAAKKP
jgi:YHS domain-containing protein